MGGSERSKRMLHRDGDLRGQARVEGAVEGHLKLRARLGRGHERGRGVEAHLVEARNGGEGHEAEGVHQRPEVHVVAEVLGAEVVGHLALGLGHHGVGRAEPRARELDRLG